MTVNLGMPSPAGGPGGSSPQASTAGGPGGSSPQASTAGGPGGSSPQASTAAPPPLAPRRVSRQILVGKGAHAVAVGGGAPVSVQSMTTTLTADVNATLQQIAE